MEKRGPSHRPLHGEGSSAEKGSHPNANRRGTNRPHSPYDEENLTRVGAEEQKLHRRVAILAENTGTGEERRVSRRRDHHGQLYSNPRLETTLDLETVQAPGRFGFPSLSSADEVSVEEGEASKSSRDQRNRLPPLLFTVAKGKGERQLPSFT